MLPVLHRPSESSAVGLRGGIGIRVRQHLRNVNRTEVCPRYHAGLAIRICNGLYAFCGKSSLIGFLRRLLDVNELAVARSHCASVSALATPRVVSAIRACR